MIGKKRAEKAKVLRGQCNSNNQVAEMMGVSESTIERYLRLANENKTPRILLMDIETAPLEVYSWGIRKQHLGHFQIKEEWFILSWAAKWLLEDGVYSDCVTPEEEIGRAHV